jgi:hypothetical protein
VDVAGNLYIADTHNYCVRAVKNGVISTIAGIWRFRRIFRDNGAATKAMLNYPTERQSRCYGQPSMLETRTTFAFAG